MEGTGALWTAFGGFSHPLSHYPIHTRGKLLSQVGAGLTWSSHDLSQEEHLQCHGQSRCPPVKRCLPSEKEIIKSPPESQGCPHRDRLHRQPSSQACGPPSEARGMWPWAQKENVIAWVEFQELSTEGLSGHPHQDVGLREGEQDLEPPVITWV